MPTGPIRVNKLKNVFFSIKPSKGSGHDKSNLYVIRTCFNKLCEPLQYLCNVSFEKCILPDHLKIAKVTPVFKAVDNAELSNYRPISVLPCFSKILESHMYNCFYKSLLDSNILYKNDLASRKNIQPTIKLCNL